jgi:hypothetical protein
LAPDARLWDFIPSLIISGKLSVCCFPSSCTLRQICLSQNLKEFPKKPKGAPPVALHPQPLKSYRRGPFCGFGVNQELFERKVLLVEVLKSKHIVPATNVQTNLLCVTS